ASAPSPGRRLPNTVLERPRLERGERRPPRSHQTRREARGDLSGPRSSPGSRADPGEPEFVTRFLTSSVHRLQELLGNISRLPAPKRSNTVLEPPLSS